MSKLHKLLHAFALVALLAACAEPPTASLPMPEEARLDEGVMGLGSGNRDGVHTLGSGSVLTTTSTTTADPGTGTTVQEEPTDEPRSPWGGGSGN